MHGLTVCSVVHESSFNLSVLSLFLLIYVYICALLSVLCTWLTHLFIHPTVFSYLAPKLIRVSAVIGVIRV